MRHQRKVSVVVPAYNEGEMIHIFLARVMPILANTGMRFEVVFVDDGSRDDTVPQVLAAARQHPEVKLVKLSRNCGKEIALTAGLAHATGDAVIPIDCDLQDPPELIHDMIAKWEEGFAVVYAQRRSRDTDTWFKRVTAGAFYRVMGRMTNVDIPANVGDYRLMDRQVVEALLQYPERNRFMKGLAAAVGFRQTSVQFDRETRAAGETKWNYWKLWNFALDGITSFSTVPLRVWTYLGLMVAASAFVYASWIIAKTLIWGVVTPGYATMMVVILFLGGIQMIGLGVLGEYVGRILVEAKQRPLYFVEKKFGFDEGEVVMLRAGAK